ncbi:MAG: alanine racemase [Bacteroidales bacterium]|nr:alanine racemase [Bacteroidales bacterium]
MKLKKPTLLLDKQKCLENIRRMKFKADRHKLIFRPHFKTHQSAGVGEWFREVGVDKITVSSVGMASYFSAKAWKDITIAFPLNMAEIDDINQLASEISLNILVENEAAVSFLSGNLHSAVGVFIKIDAGYHRTGIAVDDHLAILELIRKIEKSAHLTFKGFIVHNGHTYHASARDEILTIHNQSLEKLSHLRHFMLQKRVDAIYSVGDTPSMSLSENFENIDEIRPGNFVFYDLMQQKSGACQFSDIALALACPVVAKHNSRNEIVIYGGAVHLSKDFIQDKNGHKIFGLVVELLPTGWGTPVDDTFVKSLSQEHGIIKASDHFFKQTKIGDFIGILPVHSCLTVHAMGEFVVLENNPEKTELKLCCM